MVSSSELKNRFSVVAQVVPSILLIAIVNGGCEITLILVIWYLAVIFITASYAGPMANVVDIGKSIFPQDL